jgi:hypothetical protein
MSAGVVAMRLRLALLRHKMPVDVELLLSDTAYAREVLALCKDVGDTELVALAERVTANGRESASQALDGPQTVPVAAPLAPSFRSGIKPATAAGSAALQPSESATPTAGVRASDGINPSPLSAKRYLRGAR